MASGLYSQHVNNKKMLYLRNTVIIAKGNGLFLSIPHT